MNTTEQQSTFDKVTAILKDELGEDYEYGDYETVMDVISGYAEPGYGSLMDDDVVVLGNWNAKRWVREGDEPLTEAENLGPRLAEKLEEAGAEIEWYDEWGQCGECYKAVRTQANSYSWTPSYADFDGERFCATCMRSRIEDFVDEYYDDSNKAITWAGHAELEAIGFTRYAPGDPQTYESGWHPHQTDNPDEILAKIQREMPEHNVVFMIDNNSQFSMSFSAWTRPIPKKED